MYVCTIIDHRWRHEVRKSTAQDDIEQYFLSSVIYYSTEAQKIIIFILHDKKFEQINANTMNRAC